MASKHENEQQQGGLKSKLNWVLIAFLVIAAFFLITEHRAHLLGALPLILLLACPLLHVFMHSGHHHQGGGGHGRQNGDDSKRDKP